MNIFNVALVARAFMFISYPSKMSGDTVWIANDSVLGLGNKLPEAFTAATPLAQAGVGQTPDVSLIDSIVGLIPGSVGETSVIAIFIGAAILLITGIASWKTMLSVFVEEALQPLSITQPDFLQSRGTSILCLEVSVSAQYLWQPTRLQAHEPKAANIFTVC